MSYLDRLKNLDSGKRATYLLQKVQEAPFLQFLQYSHSAFSENQGAKVSPRDTADFDREWFEERAAIYEFEAGFLRPEAERLAMKEILIWKKMK